MGKNELRERIQRFRVEYLDTPQGREHRQRMLDEHKEIQQIYKDLRERQHAGQDVTDDTLNRLLPHNDTRHNRARGAHISTWPCIKKDVKLWFEGAKWKTSNEWPATVAWLLEIVEAGQAEDWKRWRELANHSLQKGFACGFITPIVHCLNPRLPVINSKVVKTYEAVANELGLDGEISADLTSYPENKDLILKLVDQLGPLGIYEIIEWDIYCHWNVSKQLGGEPRETEPAKPLPDLSQVSAGTENQFTEARQLEILRNKLRETQYDTKNSERFEIAVSEAFAQLGFQVECIGGSGDTDVFANGMLGEESFSVVIDAKTCQVGGVIRNPNYIPIKRHQAQHEADYAVIVAPGFGGGNTIDDARENAIRLLTVEVLTKLLDAHARSALSLYFLKNLLETGEGLIEPRLDMELAPWNDLIDAARAVLVVFEQHQREDPKVSWLTDQQVFWLLRGRGERFPEEHISQAVSFLANPLVDVLRRKDSGYILTIPANAAATRLRSIAERLSTIVSS